LIVRFVDLSDIREHLRAFYSETGGSSIDPELMIRIIGYCKGMRSEHCHRVVALRLTCKSPLGSPARYLVFRRL
jgi:transposase